MRYLIAAGVLLCGIIPCWAQRLAPEQVGFVYGCDSGLLRRTIVPGPGERPVAGLAPGECLMAADRARLADLSEQTAAATIAAATGKTPTTSRAVIVAGNVVVGAIKADPAIDSVPNALLLLHEEAMPGDKYDGKDFTRTYAVVDNTMTVLRFQDLGLPSTNPTTGVPKETLISKEGHTVGEKIIIPDRGVAPAEALK